MSIVNNEKLLEFGEDLIVRTDARYAGSNVFSTGANGLVPAPTAGDSEKFLKGDGSWGEPGGGSSIPTPVSIANGGTGNSAGYIRTGSTGSIGDNATAEGRNNVASGDAAHAEGIHAYATGGFGAHAENNYTEASGNCSHAEGDSTHATNECSHAEGCETTASEYCSHAEGFITKANNVASHAMGHYNKDMTAGGTTTNKAGDAFVIGNGNRSDTSNAFRVTFAGATYGLSAFNASGADYAEFFEWLDANPNKEDRIGYFVTLEGDKIKIASYDDYILGVISGNPSVVGNGDEDWIGRWLKDDFGRLLKEDTEDTITYKDGHTEITKGWNYISNPDYDPSKPYVERKDRPEWDYVGMLGALAVRDDGTCKVNGFCTCNENGIATRSLSGYRVIKRISENVIKIIFK